MSDTTNKEKWKLLPWFKMFVAEFLAITSHLTTLQFGAYVRIYLTLWLRPNVTLENKPETLARVSGIHPPHFKVVWAAIRSLFVVTDDGVSHDGLRAMRAQADIKLAAKAASGQTGGWTTQERNRHRKELRGGQRVQKTAPKPLESNNVVQANAKQSQSQSIRTEEEREASPSPCNSRASASLREKASSDGVVVGFPTPPKPSLAEGSSSPSEEERAANMAKLANLKRTLGGKA
jgi:uncharacterized protein YdaU (DUF1376 family)